MGFLVVLISAVVVLLTSTVSAQESTTHCFKASQTSAKVQLNCPANFTIVVRTVLYGSNSYRLCQNTRDTCVEEISDVDGSECHGRRNCSITARKIYSVKCGGYVDFARVFYDCLPVVVARNLSFVTTQTTKEMPKIFGMDTPITKTEDGNDDWDVGMILGIVGCVLGTVYISIVCIIIAVLCRRNEAKKPLADDEEQPTELDNSGFRGSGQFRERPSAVPETSLQDDEGITSRETGNRVSGRPGPDGRETRVEVYNEITTTPRSNFERNYYNNLQHASRIAPKSLFPQKCPSNLQSYNKNNIVAQTRDDESSADVSNC